MKKNISIFIFIDALGWEIIKKRSFLKDLLPYRYPVRMQFGYSSTAIPTILTGKPPIEHKHLSFYYYDPQNSPFKLLSNPLLSSLPDKIVSNWRVRHNLSKLIKKVNGYTGYFELYSMPFNKIKYFNYIEKTDMFIPGGLKPVENISDFLVKNRIPYHVSNWRLSEDNNVDSLIYDIKNKDIKFGFLYTAKLDSLLHNVTKDGKEVTPKLEYYENQIKKVVKAVKSKYSNYSISVISDHGMSSLKETIDIKKIIRNAGFKHTKDYIATYDSTMARIWYLRDGAKEEMESLLETVSNSKIVSEIEKINYGINFDDNMYGETILLVDPGVQIVPSDMGLKPLQGMHGYSPEDADSSAIFLSTDKPNNPPKWVGDYFNIMCEHATH